MLFLGEEEILDEHKTSLDEALGFLDIFLEGNDFVAGNKLTAADCSLVASVSSIVVSMIEEGIMLKVKMENYY